MCKMGSLTAALEWARWQSWLRFGAAGVLIGALLLPSFPSAIAAPAADDWATDSSSPESADTPPPPLASPMPSPVASPRAVTLAPDGAVPEVVVPPLVVPPVALDPALEPAIDELRALSSLDSDQNLGDTYLAFAVRLKLQLLVGPLPSGANAQYAPGTNTIMVSAAAVTEEDPRAVASLLAHEITHVGQVQILGEGGNRDCVHMEVEAFQAQSAVWASLWDGDPPSRTAMERELTEIAAILTADGEPGLYKVVVDTPSYQQECHLFVPDSPGPGRSRPGAIPWPALAFAQPAPTLIPTPTPVRPTPTPVGSRLTSQLASRCYSLAASFGRDAASTRASSFSRNVSSGFYDPVSTANTQCLDIADKYGAPGIDCYEPAARDYWRSSLDPASDPDAANRLLVGRVASCLRTLTP